MKNAAIIKPIFVIAVYLLPVLIGAQAGKDALAVLDEKIADLAKRQDRIGALPLHEQKLELLDRELQSAREKKDQKRERQVRLLIGATLGQIGEIQVKELLDSGKAMELYHDAVKKYGMPENFHLARLAQLAYTEASLDQFIAGNYPKALSLHEQGYALRDKNPSLAKNQLWKKSFWYLTIQDAAKARFQPAEYTQKILAVFIKKTQLTVQENGTEKKYDMQTSDVVYRQTVRNMRLFQRLVEIFSAGRLRIEMDMHVLDAAVTRITVGAKNDPLRNSIEWDRVVPYPDRLFFEKMAATDVIFSFYNIPIPSYCYGGSGRFSVLPYAQRGPVRGVSSFVIQRASNSVSLIFHEWFHSAERLFKFHTQDDFLKGQFHRITEWFPNYKNNRYGSESWDYWHWQLSVNIPRTLADWAKTGNAVGFKKFGYSLQHPYRVTEEMFRVNREALQAVSLDDREKANQLKEKADAAWKKNDKEQADMLYAQALRVNPAFFDARRHLGQRAQEKKDHKTAITHFQAYLAGNADYRIAARLAALHAQSQGDLKEAEVWWKRALDWTDTPAQALQVYAEIGWYSLNANRPDIAAQYLSRAPIAPEDDRSAEVQTLYGLSLLASGSEEPGRARLRETLAGSRARINKNKNLGWLIRNRAIKLADDKKYEDVLLLAELGLDNARPDTAAECLFLKGEALFRTGNVRQGRTLMQEALGRKLKRFWSKRYESLK